MNEKTRILQANLNNQGGAFSVVYEAQQKLQEEFIFDYFSAEKFVENVIYKKLKKLGSHCTGGVECRSRFLKQYEVYKAFKKYLLKYKYEYVHIHSDTAWKMSVYYLAARKAGVKNIVVHSHSSGINGHYKKINYLLHLLAKPIISKADYKCACSDVAAKWMYNTADGIIFIRNGVDIERYSFNASARDKIRGKLNIANQVVVGSVSDFTYPKNPEFLYELVKEFKDNQRYIFLFVGNRENCILKKYVDTDSGIRNVIFTGMVTNTEEYLSSMDIFVLPSRFEGLPMCAVEAQVSGLYTMISDKVTPHTKCSTHFEILSLDSKKWKSAIQNANLDYDREGRSKFLDESRASVSGTADMFRKIYTGG